MIDKRLLVDSVTVRKVIGLDEFGKESLGDPFDLAPIRFDREIKITGSRESNPKVQQAGIIYNYPQHTGVQVDDSWLHAKVHDGQYEYEVIGFTVNTLPYRSDVFSYEIEVI